MSLCVRVCICAGLWQICTPCWECILWTIFKLFNGGKEKWLGLVIKCPIQDWSVFDWSGMKYTAYKCPANWHRCVLEWAGAKVMQIIFHGKIDFCRWSATHAPLWGWPGFGLCRLSILVQSEGRNGLMLTRVGSAFDFMKRFFKGGIKSTYFMQSLHIKRRVDVRVDKTKLGKAVCSLTFCCVFHVN